LATIAWTPLPSAARAPLVMSNQEVPAPPPLKVTKTWPAVVPA